MGRFAVVSRQLSPVSLVMRAFTWLGKLWTAIGFPLEYFWDIEGEWLG